MKKLELNILLIFIAILITTAKTLEKSLLNMNMTDFILKTEIDEKLNFSKEVRFKSKQIDCTKLEGWLRYLQISEESLNLPSSFIKNKMFIQQINENPSLKIEKDKDGNYLNIPKDDMFWVSLVGSEIRISTSRVEKYAQCENRLLLKDLVKQDSKNPSQSGVEDMGNFSEGHCFMLKFIIDGKHHLWELCSESQPEKEIWKRCLISKKLKEDNEINLIALKAAQNKANDTDKITLNNETIKKKQDTKLLQIGKAFESGWIADGDWSQCSKKCGTGKKVRHLKCVKKDNSCKGPSIEEKLCRIQKCKNIIEEHMSNLKKVSEGQWKYLGNWSPCSKNCGGGVKIRRRRCITKEGCDGKPLIRKSCNTNSCDKENSNKFNENIFSPCERLEGNLKLNNKIISHIVIDLNHMDIFTDPLMLHPFYTVKIQNIDEILKKNDKNCLKIKDKLGKSTKLCGDEESDISKWKRQIEDFKFNCDSKNGIKDKLKRIKNDEDSYNKIASLKNPEDRMSSFTKKVLEEEKILNKEREDKLLKKFDQFKLQVNDLLIKEDKYEQEQENLEKEKINKEKEDMNKLLRKEEKRAKELAEEMSELGRRDLYKAKEKAIKRKMKLMMRDIQKKIDIKRKNLANKLKRMKKLHILNQKLAAKKLLNIKKNMGKKLENMNKKGSPNKCFSRTTQQIKDYCECNYKDVLLNKECRNKSQFCYMCCDNEIGKFNKENLDCCYNKCDKIPLEGKCDSFINDFKISKLNPHVLLHHAHLHHIHKLMHGHGFKTAPRHVHILHRHSSHLPVKAHIDLFP